MRNPQQSRANKTPSVQPEYSEVSSKPYDWIIWDWNGTLLNDVWLCHWIANQLAREQSLPECALQEYRMMFEFPIIRFYERVGHEFKQKSFEALSHDFMRYYESRRQECALHESVPVTLEKMQCHFKQAILSAYPQNSLEKVVREKCIEPCFDVIQGHQDVYAGSKTNNAHHLLEQIQTTGDRCLLIGDTIHDYDVAQAIGAECLLLSHGHQHEHHLCKTNARVVHSLASIPQIALAGEKNN